MTIQDHWLINGKKYFVIFEGAALQKELPKTIERTLNGKHVLYVGKGSSERVTQMMILIPRSVDTGWGTEAELTTAYQSTSPIAIVENDDTISYNGVIVSFSEQTIAPSMAEGTVITIAVQKFLE